jgi:hypothetical protein
MAVRTTTATVKEIHVAVTTTTTTTTTTSAAAKLLLMKTGFASIFTSWVC